MTKQQEVDIISDAIHALGKDSYLGPWLNSWKPHLVSSLTSDLMPIMPEFAKDEAEKIISEAKAEAKRITDGASEKADRQRKIERDNLQQQKDALRHSVNQLEHTLAAFRSNNL